MIKLLKLDSVPAMDAITPLLCLRTAPFLANFTDALAESGLAPPSAPGGAPPPGGARGFKSRGSATARKNALLLYGIAGARSRSKP